MLIPHLSLYPLSYASSNIRVNLNTLINTINWASNYEQWEPWNNSKVWYQGRVSFKKHEKKPILLSNMMIGYFMIEWQESLASWFLIRSHLEDLILPRYPRQSKISLYIYLRYQRRRQLTHWTLFAPIPLTQWSTLSIKSIRQFRTKYSVRLLIKCWVISLESTTKRIGADPPHTYSALEATGIQEKMDTR